MSEPFLTLYVPTFARLDGSSARPVSLQRCIDSIWNASRDGVETQTYIAWDRTLGGAGVGGMFAQVPANTGAVRGRYVMILGDDDELAATDVVRRLKEIAEGADFPDVLIVSTEKGQHGRLPYDASGPPVCGRIDLGCVITRRDVWLQHVSDYGDQYEGDYHHVKAMWDAGRRFHYATELLLSRGAVSHGRAEAPGALNPGID